MKLKLGNKNYTYLIGYQNEDRYRNAFNKLANSIFGLSFEEWYQLGYWNDKYIPYTLFDDERAIANASVNIMDFNIFGTQKRCIQVGTVITDLGYRNQQLSRFLMDTILEEWNKQCDFIYLYANQTVLDFYPKFGFEQVTEYECFKSVESNVKNISYNKLNMDNQSDRDKIYDYIKNSKQFGSISMINNPDLVMFYCLFPLKENVYYIESLDVIALTTFNGSQLHLWDIFSKVEVELDNVISSLLNKDIKEVVLGFTPKDYHSYDMREISGNDVLFVQKGRTEFFDKHNAMFPLLSHA